MITIISDAWYCVMLAQLPPGGISCAAGDPGVGFGQPYTDESTGMVTMQSPVTQVATATGCQPRALWALRTN